MSPWENVVICADTMLPKKMNPMIEEMNVFIMILKIFID